MNAVSSADKPEDGFQEEVRLAELDLIVKVSHFAVWTPTCVCLTDIRHIHSIRSDQL